MGTKETPIGYDIGSYVREARRQINEEIRETTTGFWKSGDIATAESIVVEPGRPIAVDVVVPDDLGPLDLYYPWSLHLAYVHTRSRFAQLGLEVRQTAGIAMSCMARPEYECDDSRHLSTVFVDNHSQRAVYLPEDTRLFNLYYYTAQPLRGENLIKSIGTDISIGGQEGEDWRWWYAGEEKRLENIEGIEFFIDFDSRAYIPPNPVPIVINDGSALNHNREEVASYLRRPIPIQREHLLTIAKSKSTLDLSILVHGLVDTGLSYRNYPIGTHSVEGHQLASVIMEGGSTSGQFITEFLENTLESTSPRTVAVRFFPAGFSFPLPYRISYP